MYTDTLFDFVRVVGLLLIPVIIIKLQAKYTNDKKYNWLVFIIVIFIIFGCYVFASKYILCEYNKTLIAAITGALMGVYSDKWAKYSLSMIMSGIVCIIIVSIISGNFSTELFNSSKPIKIAINKAQIEGHDIEEDDYIFATYGNRFQPIVIKIIRFKDYDSSEDILNLEYYKGKITEFKVE